MPVGEQTPEPLKSWLQNMEATVQNAKQSLGFAAPEMQNLHWAAMQEELAAQLDIIHMEMLDLITAGRKLMDEIAGTGLMFKRDKFPAFEDAYTKMGTLLQRDDIP